METLKETSMTTLRNKKTSMAKFRQAAEKLSIILAHEASTFLKTKKIEIETPLDKTSGTEFDSDVVLIPILRSGLVLLPAFLEFYPQATVGFVGMKRDEKTAIAKLYYQNIPTIKPNGQVIVLDPMLATGGSLADTLDILVNSGINQEQILFVGVICAQEGLDRIHHKFPKIKTIIAAHDPKLNDKKFIMPGLGDFGDRFFGTE